MRTQEFYSQSYLRLHDKEGGGGGGLTDHRCMLLKSLIHVIHVVDTYYSRCRYVLFTLSICVIQVIDTGYSRCRYMLFKSTVHVIHVVDMC